MDTISIASFNCRNIKSSVSEIQDLCNKYDVILLQETWLLDFELPFLSTIHTNFYGKGIATVKTNDAVITGRPHGGLGILWKKKFGNICKVIDISDDRIMGIELSNNGNKVVIFNVYLPYCCESNMDSFTCYLSKLDVFMKDVDTLYSYVIGDFNAHVSEDRSHLFGNELHNFCANENYILSDIKFCDSGSYTYYSEAHHTTSWLDHVMCSQTAHTLIKDITVEYGAISSDHHPIICTLEFNLDKINNCSEEMGNARTKSIKWDSLSVEQIASYKSLTELHLGEIKIDHSLILCDDPGCKDPAHVSAIEQFYGNIVNALKDASKDLYICNKNSFKQIPGWNDYCKSAHSQAREAYCIWRSSGKPKYGPTFIEMNRTRLYFKFVLRKCRKDNCKASADSLAKKLLDKNDKSFWSEIKKLSSSNTPIVSTVDGITGSSNICNMWQEHFKALLNSSEDTVHKDFVLSSISNISSKSTYFERFTVDDVKDAFKSIKCGKTCGLDGIYGEHLKHAHDILHVMLSLLFNVIIIHGYIPVSLMDTLLIPLVKDKNGVLSDKDNYRPLAVTCIISKVLEILILNRYKDHFNTTDNQFGFKPSLSTDMCIYSLKQITEYYVTHGSPVYICFLDASKAFDKINHWSLFKKLLHRNIPTIIVRLLYVWYAIQHFFVRWNGYLSSGFQVINGVRQGSILSPYFFNVYIDELSVRLSQTSTGCILNNVRVNHLFYADDSVLLSPSPQSMQVLLKVCDKFAKDHELQFNIKKSCVQCIRPKWLKDLRIPTLYLNNLPLSIISEHKYLGMKVCDDMKDDVDMHRQMRCIYSRGNVLVKRFYNCSDNVKITLFKAYCSSFYGLNLWCAFSKKSYKKVKSSYNKMFRKFLGVKREDMLLHMLQNNVKTFGEIERNLIFSFKKRILNCDNLIVSTICDSTFYLNCDLTKHWNRTLYT